MEDVLNTWQERLQNVEKRIEFLHEQIDKKLVESVENSVKDELLELKLLLDMQEVSVSLVASYEELRSALDFLV